MFNSQLSTASLDLHGCNGYDEAHKKVNSFVKQAIHAKIATARIVTGKGNHPHGRDLRGTLYKSLPRWLNMDAEFRSKIQYIRRNEGSYNIIFIVIKREFDDEKSVRHRETSLMRIIRSTDDEETRVVKIDALLAKNKAAIYEIDRRGNTSLMVAASTNSGKIIQYLLEYEQINFLDIKLLKQCNLRGESALMVAVMNGRTGIVEYLLKRAPSLLKLRSYNGDSVFHAAMKLEQPQQMISVLSNHLMEHKREKGYTSLFPDLAKQKMQLDAQISSPVRRRLVILDTRRRSNLVSSHSWLFSDRLCAFAQKVKRVRASNKKLLYFSQSKDLPTFLQGLQILFKRSTLFRKLFLRFNNALKPRSQRRYKHASTFTTARFTTKRRKWNDRSPKHLVQTVRSKKRSTPACKSHTSRC